jgi:hypothetical protein
VRIAIDRTITGPLADELLETHKLLFDPLDELAIQPQSIPDEQFLELLAHPDVLEFVGWTDDGRPDGLMITTNNLDLVPWINPRVLRARYPEQSAAGTVYYVLCLQMHPRSQDGPLIRAIIESFSRFLGQRMGVLAFDSCQWDIDNLGIPHFVAKWADKVVKSDNAEIDAQRYYAYAAVELREIDLRDHNDDGIEIDLTVPAPDAVRTTAVHA